MRYKLTHELEVGDTIETWWRPGRDIITAIRPYQGPLKEMEGGVILEFALNKTGMSAEPGGSFKVVSP